MNRLHRIIQVTAFILGIALISVGLFAYQLRIDHNPEFGPKRILMIAAGAICILWSISEVLERRLLRRESQKETASLPVEHRYLAAANAHGAATRMLKQSRVAHWLRRYQVGILTLTACLLSLTVFLFVFSSGKLGEWPDGTKYYHFLAIAFRQGQVHLPVEPTPELLASPFPYDYSMRGDIPLLWDASFYEGKYYLYWGPTPALAVILVEALTGSMLKDPALVLGFTMVTTFFSILLVSAIWKRFRNILPGWIMAGGIFAAAVNVPLVWQLTRPGVYEAAIVSGQAFLMAGIYYGFCGLAEKRVSGWKLFLSGLAFTLAAGSRVNLAVSIFILSLAVCITLLRQSTITIQKRTKNILIYLAPLAAGAALIALYNLARFGSPLEFGHRYQLTGPALPGDYSRVFSLDYFIPNLYTYLFRPPELQLSFPFITIPWINEFMWPFFVKLPVDYYYPEAAAGLLLIVPVVLIALLSAAWFAWLRLNGAAAPKPPLNGNHRAVTVIWIVFGAVIVAQLAVLLVYIAASLRYLADISSLAVISSTIFFAWIINKYNAWPWKKRLLSVFWASACLLTVLIGILIGFTGYLNQFRQMNPGLYEFLERVFLIRNS
ncbi:MAG: hypothetical protein EHM41_22945 [Chloroflexi bacterium]|nr:MAG: hypothetical protein EHM41_22945 [Chloroflexota bacterium]